MVDTIAAIFALSCNSVFCLDGKDVVMCKPKKIMFRDADGCAVYVDISMKNGVLSITGTIVDDSGSRSSGQCQGSIKCASKYQKALVDLWNRWHLNDLRACCPHQRALGWHIKAGEIVEYLDLYGRRKTSPVGFLREDVHSCGLLCKPCPVCGYEYGSAWKREELPPKIGDAIDYLKTKIEAGEGVVDEE